MKKSLFAAGCAVIAFLCHHAVSANVAGPQYDADVWPDITPETWSGPDAETRAEGKTGVHDFTVRACAPGETIDWSVPKKVRVKTVKGRPQFTVDGKPVYALWGTVRSDREVRHSTAPLNFVTVWNSSRKWWPKTDSFDPAEIDRKAKWHIERYPDSMLVWDITINPPPDWRDANPEEIAHDEKGAMDRRSAASVNYSFASDKAIDVMMRAAERAIRHIEGSPYANRIAGYRINSGHTAEWLGWDSADKDAALDFAPVAKRKFAEFAKEFYPELADCAIPAMSERTLLDSPHSVVWEMPKHLRAMAYHDFYSRAMADCAIRMCARAREVVGEDKLIGTYFGYVMTLMEYGRGQMKAHFSTKRLLDGIRGKVDFLMSPPAYEYWNRGLGDSLMDMKPFASIADHGIMPVVEDDTRTYRNLALKSNGYSQGRTHAQTVSLMRRNMGIAICRGMPFYTYAITSGSEFDYPQFAEDAAALRRFGDVAIGRGTSRNAQIAVVVSEEAIKAMPDLRNAKAECLPVPVQWYPPSGKVVRRTETHGRPFASDVHGRLCSRMARIGAPVDYRLAEDLADNPGDYRLYLFPNALLADKAVVRAAQKLRARNCTIVWTYAPGYVSRGGNSTESMRELTGMEFEKCDDGMDSAIKNCDGSVHGATGHPVSPLFRAKGNVEVLGSYPNGDCAFAAAKTGMAQSIFYGSYFLDLPTLRSLAKRAGVHIYSDSTDPMEANGDFVTLHTRFAGKKTVRLPKRTSVYDVFGGKIVAKNVDEFSFDAPLHSSWLFYCADDAGSVPAKK